MDIIREIENTVTKDLSSLTFGNFDGVHLGHQAIIEEMVKKSKAENIESILVTFNPHPQAIIGKNAKKRFLIQSFNQRMEIIEKLGVDKVVCIKFDKKFSKIKPIKFIELLVQNCLPKYIFSNRNNYFGYRKEGDMDFLVSQSKIMNYKVIDVGYIKKSDKIISSSLIRKQINNGDLKSVKNMLGREFSIQGKVVKGSGLGTKIGFPTANVEIPESAILPNDGVYYVKVLFKKKIFAGMCNIGVRPTISSQREKCVEVHLLKGEGIDLYEKKIKIIIIKFIRNETKFKTVDELKGQLVIDKELCLKY